MASIQVNVRMDPELKRRGDAALAGMGLTPTKAINLLWKCAASREGEKIVSELIKCEQSEAQGDQVQPAILEGGRLVEVALADQGVSLGAERGLRPEDLEALRTQAADGSDGGRVLQ